MVRPHRTGEKLRTQKVIVGANAHHLSFLMKVLDGSFPVAAGRDSQRLILNNLQFRKRTFARVRTPGTHRIRKMRLNEGLVSIE